MAADNNVVLVVGAGPSGLMMALELARRGVTVRVVEKLPQRSVHSRALVVHARSLELLQDLGLEQEFLAAGFRTIGLSGYVRTRHAFDAEFSGIGAAATPFPFVLFISQAQTERILEQALAQHGVRVERSVALTQFHMDDHGVDATLTQARGASETFRCAYLVGCDGAHSAVRHGLGLNFAGAPYEQAFVLADARINWALPRDRLVLILGAPGLVAAFPFADGSHRLILAAPGSMGQADSPLTLAETEQLVRKVSGIEVRLSDPVWLSRFHLHHRSVERYGVGRAFLVGDAAHIHSPAGGQGMNTGLQDAANLAWKLALVVAGQAAPGLLESYSAERHPVGQILLKSTDRLFEIAATGNPWIVALRNFIVPRLAPWVLHYQALRRRLFRFISQLGIRYPDSPVVVEMGTWRAGPRAGDRAPDVGLRRGGEEVTLFQAMRGPEHRLLVFNNGAARDTRELVRLLPFPCRAIVIGHGLASDFSDPDDTAFRLYGVSTGGAVYLLRPDGYVGARAPLLEAESALTQYTRVLGVAPR